MNKDIKKIFVVLILCSLADGFFYNFQQLWMQDNLLSIKTIGTVLAIAALLSVSVIFLCSNLITQNKLKKFLTIIISSKIIIITLLFFLNHSGSNILIKFLIMLDYVIDVEIYACIYPMLAIIEKGDKKYALKSILYNGFYYIAVIISTIILGKNISQININYNIYLLISLIFLIIALPVLKRLKIEKYYKQEKKDKELEIIKKLIKNISGQKSIKKFILYLFSNNISYSCLTGLILTMFISTLNYSQETSSYVIMILGIASSIIGYITLKFLTFKNNYINIFIKFGIRFILYIIAFITCQKILMLIALSYTIITGSSYEHIATAPYVNMIETKYQLAFCNLTEMLAYLGKSIGTFITGIMMTINIRYNFIVAAVFTGIGLYFAYKALYLRNKEGIK